MSANVGLTTPRGSGTSGYVQKNLSLLRQVNRDRGAPYSADSESQRHQQRKPDPAILEHDRKRRIENKVFELRDKLEEEGVDEDEIDAQVDALRIKLTNEDAGSSRVDGRGLKSHQVHDLAAAKIEETEKLRRALGIRKDYQEGSHWKRGEERMRESIQERPRPVADAEPRGRDVKQESPSRSPSLSPSRSRSRSRSLSRSRSRSRSETPPRRRRRRDTSSGESRSRSPPRRRRRYSSASRSLSPPARRRRPRSPSSEREAPPRQRRRLRNSSSDESRSRSPPRRRRDSPPPRSRRERSYSSYDSESDRRRSRSK